MKKEMKEMKLKSKHPFSVDQPPSPHLYQSPCGFISYLLAPAAFDQKRIQCQDKVLNDPCRQRVEELKNYKSNFYPHSASKGGNICSKNVQSVD